MDMFIAAFAISLAINGLLFLLAFASKSDKLTDLSYALTFVAIIIFGFVTANTERSVYDFILLGAVLLWALRVGSFLLHRVIKSGRDKRFDDVRHNFVKFGRFWLGQAVAVPVILSPAIMALDTGVQGGWLTMAGAVTWLFGFALETLADDQKRRFNANPSNKGKWIASGTWKYSRHPNYFGEICVWLGIYLVAFTALDGPQRLVGLVSPLFISVLLIFISGIPPLEKSADRRWGENRNYQSYKQRTSILIPLPPKR